jgi:alanine racemase
MNITTVDVSDVPEVAVGDEVVVISKNPKDSNSIENMAQLCGAIPYEIVVHIPTQLRRTLV